jgi:hypothetical protein
MARSVVRPVLGDAPLVRDISVLPPLQYHLYALVEGLPRRWRPPDAGVGAGPVLPRPVRGLSLITTPLERPAGRSPGAVARHDTVVQSLLDAGAVLPFRFGTYVAADEIDGWLGVRMGRFRAALADLRGCVEMTVRLLCLDQRGAPDGATLDAAAERLVEHAGIARWRYRRSGPGHPASLSFLVSRHDIHGFLARIAPVASRAPDLAVVPVGPWPPYSFTPAADFAPLGQGALAV